MQCSLAFPLFAGRLPLAPTSLVATPSSGEGPLLIPATPQGGLVLEKKYSAAVKLRERTWLDNSICFLSI